MDDDIFKHLLDSEAVLKSRADEIKRKKGEIDGYRKDLVALKEELEGAEKQLVEKSTELSQAKYQQQIKSRQLELINGKLGELKEEFQCIVKEKNEIKEKRDNEREKCRAKAAHNANLLNNQNEQLESSDQSIVQKLRTAEAEIEAKRDESVQLEEEHERISNRCAEYNINQLEQMRIELLAKKRKVYPVIKQPHYDTILQLEYNIEKFEKEVQLMSEELVKMRQDIPRDPQPHLERLAFQGTRPIETSQSNVPQCVRRDVPQRNAQTLQFTEGRCVVPSVSPYFNPSFSARTTNPGIAITTTKHSPIIDDMFDDGIVDDDLIMLCNEAENLN